MREALPDRDRWLAFGILAGVLLVAYLVLVHPWWTVPMLAVGERIDTLQQRDLRVRMELQQAPQVRQRLQQVQAQAARVPGFMTERSPELATAALVQRLETAVVEASPGNRSCAITNRSPMTEPRQQRFPRAVVQVRLRCGNPELAAVLHSLESGSPRLFVDNLNVLAQRYFFSAAQGGQGAGLDVSFDLYGYLQPQAQPTPPPRPRPGGAAGAR
jgi:general secretion pathway protein M